MKYYKVIVTKTSKNAGRNDEGYSVYDNRCQEFNSVKKCKEWLSEEYHYCKTIYPMFRDDKDGNSVKIGKIYAYKEKGYSWDKTILCQDWVEIKEVKEKTIKF